MDDRIYPMTFYTLSTVIWEEVGIIDDQIWMLCTPVIHQYPLTFAREAKRFIDSRTEPYLWNVVDKRNTVHIKLLKFLGFTLHEELLFGPNNLPFIRFDK